ncbi:MAG: sporulation protein YunB [Oscillospiraceae bacterium]|nr:sporulation protein YunB [Oscillospiraceae bacterium]
MAKAHGFFKRLGIKLIAAGMVAVGLLLLMDLSFRDVIETVNAYECHEIVSRVLNDAISDELENADTDYSKLVTLSTNSDGEVISVESNVVNINKLKTGIIRRLERELARLSSYNLEIPIGTLLGIQLLHGKGFNIGMTVEPVGMATASIISEFVSAGINQTLHRIVIEITTSVESIIPGFSTRVPVTTTVVAAETVIVGRVPDAYTHVVASESLSGYLNDFGAVID